MEKKVIEGTRWLLLKNPENRAEESNEPQQLQRALELNQPLTTFYCMKEDLRRLWSQKTRKRAARLLVDCISRAMVSGISMMEKFDDTLQSHIVTAFWPTTITRSQPARWRVRTTKSKP